MKLFMIYNMKFNDKNTIKSICNAFIQIICLRLISFYCDFKLILLDSQKDNPQNLIDN